MDHAAQRACCARDGTPSVHSPQVERAGDVSSTPRSRCTPRPVRALPSVAKSTGPAACAPR